MLKRIIKNPFNILIPSPVSSLLPVFYFVFFFSFFGNFKSFFCEDTTGDLKLNRQFVLTVGDDFISKAYIKNGRQLSPQKKEKIVFENSNSFVAVQEKKDVGVKTFSIYKGKNGVWTAIRTYVEEDYAFSQKSNCIVQ